MDLVGIDSRIGEHNDDIHTRRVVVSILPPSQFVIPYHTIDSVHDTCSRPISLQYIEHLGATPRTPRQPPFDWGTSNKQSPLAPFDHSVVEPYHHPRRNVFIMVSTNQGVDSGIVVGVLAGDVDFVA